MANIALFPGSYKPPHIGHYTAAKQAAQIAGKVKVFVGSGERDGITQDMSVQLWELYTQNDPNIEIIQSESSPVTDVYDYVELEAKDGDIIYFIKGDKDADDPRFKNIEKYAEKVKKKIKKRPIDVPDIKSRTGKEMSGRLMRAYIKSEDKRSFIDGLPKGTNGEQAWNIVTGLEEDLYNPNDHVLDYMKSSEWKAGMPDGHKEDIPRSYKYQRGGIYGRMYESRGGESELHIYDFDETIARVETPIPYTVESPDGKIIEKGETTSVEFEKTKDFLKDTYDEGITINWDFKAFANLISKGTLNNEIFQKLLKSIENPNAKVTILTARAIGLPVTKFLKDQGIWAYVVPLGLNKEKGQPVTGEDKSNWIEKRIKNTTKKVIFIDDAPENRKAIYTLKDKYPNIEFDVETPPEINENYTKSSALINDIPVSLETMNTPDQQMKGMMGRDSLEGGMLFSYNQVQRRDFHMKNCKISLDIVFIKQGKINNIHSNCPPCKQNNCPNYSGLADNVLEFPGGYCNKNNINIGDEINLSINPNLNEAPINLKRRSEGVKTYGDLKNIIKSITKKQKIGKATEVAIDVVIDFIPGAGSAKSTVEFLMATFNKPDTVKTDTWIDKLDVDDELSTIVDDTVENNFLTMMAKTIENKPDEEILSSTFDMNTELIEYLKGKYKGRTVSIDETKYGSQYLLAQYKDKIQLKHGHQQYRNLQTLMSQQKDEEVETWLKVKGYITKKNENYPPYKANFHQQVRYKASDVFTKDIKKAEKMGYKENVFTKEWWSNIINEHILTEGGAAGHMAHPFDLPDVNSGKDLKDLFVKAANSLQLNPGSIKIDGVNSSIRLIDLDGEKQFVMDRGSKKPLDIKGITKDDLGDRFKTKDGSPHGMVKVGGEVLDMFNEALPSLEADLKKLGAWEDPNILFNMEYVSGKTNVQDYNTNFIAIHGLNKVESKEVQGKRGPLIKRASSEVSYDKAALQSMLDNLAPIAEKNGFEVYGSVPTEIKGKPNFGSALSKSYTVKSNEGDKTQSLDKWLSELNIIPKEDFIFIDGIKKGALTKLIYTSLLDGGNIDELFKSEEDKEKAIGGFVTYLATEKLGDEVLKVLDSPMGSAYDHEGVVIRDEKIANVPFKITGKFILGGMYSDF